MAFYDALTTLPNRTLLIQRLEHAFTRRRDDGHRLAVLFMDMDRFKIINDSLGHSAGDVLLRHVAERLRKEVRDGNTVGR